MHLLMPLGDPKMNRIIAVPGLIYTVMYVTCDTVLNSTLINAPADDPETSFVLFFFFDELTFQRYLHLRIYHFQLPILTPMCLPYPCT